MKASKTEAAGRAYFGLQNLAKETGRTSNEQFQLYVLEAFLDRLSRSPHNVNLVLKGGVLLAAFGDRRPARDVDLQAHALSNDPDAILQVVCEVASIEVDDGVVYDVVNATAETIRDEEEAFLNSCLNGRDEERFVPSVARSQRAAHQVVGRWWPERPSGDS